MTDETVQERRDRIYHQLTYIDRIVMIDYTNWKGERRVRPIVPLNVFFGSTNWHPDPQWLLLAEDVETKEDKMFAMKDIHKWTPKQN